MDKLRVLVADDHELIRAVMVALLSPQFEVVSSVSDGDQLVQAALLSKPDAIVSDIQMPLIDGFSARKELQSKGIYAPFVFVTTRNMEELPPLPEGAVGFVQKTDLAAELALAVLAVLLGRAYLSQSFQAT